MLIGDPFIILDSIDSTNSYAIQQVHDHLASHGQVFFALEQFGGKGQQGKVWKTEPGANITMSVILLPAQDFPTYPFLFNAAVSLACLDFLSTHIGEEARIKWPNDLYWRDRKAGGILIENFVKGSRWNAAVIGVGINVNQVRFDPELPNPVSMKQITGKTADVKALALELCAHIGLRWQQFLLFPGSILAEYQTAMYKVGKKARFRSGNRNFEAVVGGTDKDGLLILLTPLEEKFRLGEISWV